MKKVLFFAAAALTMLAACNKTEVVYDNDPQEIAMFAVSNVATKAPVSGTTFLDGDNMRVSAYLAETDANNVDKRNHYFSNILFQKGSGTTWVGGQYWPLSKATMNFVAVTQIGGGVAEEGITYDETTDAFTVTLDANNASTISQPDVMYAVGRGTNTPGSANAPVAMEFKHALAWVNFCFASNVTEAGVLVVNSVDLYTRYNGVFTITPVNFTEPTAALSAAVNWTSKAGAFSIPVPNADNSAVMAHMDMSGLTDYQSFGNGLLVVPMADVDEVDPYFVISYTIKQSDGNKTYTYKHLLKDVVWEAAKKYTYNINITLKEIEVSPTVDDWDIVNPVVVPLG